jgi:cell division protein FtsL
MEQQRRRWRIRLNTLMLLILIAALVSYIVVERWHRQQAAQRQVAEMLRAAAEAEQVRLKAQEVKDFFQAGVEIQSPTGKFPARSTAPEGR